MIRIITICSDDLGQQGQFSNYDSMTLLLNDLQRFAESLQKAQTLGNVKFSSEKNNMISLPNEKKQRIDALLDLLSQAKNLAE